MPASFQSALRRSFVGAWRWLIEEDSVTATPEVAVLYGVCIGAAGRGLALDAFIEAIHPDDIDRFQRELSAAVRRGSNIDLTYRVIRGDGSVEQVAVMGSCIRFLDDRPRRWVSSSTWRCSKRDTVSLNAWMVFACR
ncbi:MAG: PAS domain-containing protein [Bosea sp. (in: a-proteobacteria)]|nr:PAS domain-containing protein [Bosea sp. (in: a-proteobacteria)]